MSTISSLTAFPLPTPAAIAARRWASSGPWPGGRTTPNTLRPGGYISGPTLFGLADLAFWFATFTVLGPAPMAVTSELSIAFLRPALGGDVLARAELMKVGKTRIYGEVRLWVDGAPIALSPMRPAAMRRLSTSRCE